MLFYKYIAVGQRPDGGSQELQVEHLRWLKKLDYIHYNPVEAGFVSKPEEWLYSSAIDYYEGKGLLEIKILDILGV